MATAQAAEQLAEAAFGQAGLERGAEVAAGEAAEAAEQAERPVRGDVAAVGQGERRVRAGAGHRGDEGGGERGGATVTTGTPRPARIGPRMEPPPMP